MGYHTKKTSQIGSWILKIILLMQQFLKISRFNVYQASLRAMRQISGTIYNFLNGNLSCEEVSLEFPWERNSCLQGTQCFMAIAKVQIVQLVVSLLNWLVWSQFERLTAFFVSQCFSILKTTLQVGSRLTQSNWLVQYNF